MIETTPDLYPIVMFAEGGTSNNTCILPFKKGAFFSEKAIRPVYIKYDYGSFSPAWDVLGGFEHMILMNLNCEITTATLHVLPDFKPNEFMFKKFEDKGAERWEIYAWVIRDIMASHGNFDKDETPYNIKFQYEKYMRCVPNVEDPSKVVVNN